MADERDSSVPGSGEDAPIPLEPVAEDVAARKAAPLGKGSLLSGAGDQCPNCGAAMGADAVVCMSCGYDMTANRVVTPKVGVDEVESEPEVKGAGEFVKGGGAVVGFAIAGAVVLIAAAVAAAANAPKKDLGVQAASALLVLYRGVVYTGVGMAAVWCAARFVEERVGKLDVAIARTFLAVSVFWLVSSMRLPIESEWLERSVRWPVAMGCYWLALFVLFRRSRAETVVLALLNVGGWMFIEMGVQLGVWLQDAAGK